MNTQRTRVDVEQYQREGYLVLRGVLPPDALPPLRDEADRLMALFGRDAERYPARIEWERNNLLASEQAGMERVIRKLEPILDFSPTFAGLAFEEAVSGPAMDIFHGAVELFEDKINLKLPGGSRYPWHQDWNCCWRAHTDELITCFIYLDHADATNGCLQVIPGSHLGKPMLPFKEGSKFEIDPAYVDQSKIVPVPLAAGDMIVFDPYLLHHSDRNTSNTPRRTIIYTYNPARLGKVNEGRFLIDQSGEG